MLKLWLCIKQNVRNATEKSFGRLEEANYDAKIAYMNSSQGLVE